MATKGRMKRRSKAPKSVETPEFDKAGNRVVVTRSPTMKDYRKVVAKKRKTSVPKAARKVSSETGPTGPGMKGYRKRVAKKGRRV